MLDHAPNISPRAFSSYPFYRAIKAVRVVLLRAWRRGRFYRVVGLRRCLRCRQHKIHHANNDISAGLLSVINRTTGINSTAHPAYLPSLSPSCEASATDSSRTVSQRRRLAHEPAWTFSRGGRVWRYYRSTCRTRHAETACNGEQLVWKRHRLYNWPMTSGGRSFVCWRYSSKTLRRCPRDVTVRAWRISTGKASQSRFSVSCL